MWSNVFRIVGGSLLTFALIWALVLAWWQSNDYQPSSIDLGLYLAALPLALVGGYLLLRGFIDHLKAPAVAPPAAAPTLRDDDPLLQASVKTEAAERGYTIGVIDSFVVTSVGAGSDDLLAAVEDGKRPGPSSRLTDNAGFPVFAAEASQLDVDAMVDQFSEEAGVLRELSRNEQLMRSLSLLEPILESANARLQDIRELGGEPFVFRVLWLVPAAWRTLDLAALKAWLQSKLFSLWEKGQPDIRIVLVANEVEALRVLDEVTLRTNRDSSNHDLTLLIGAVSAVDEWSIEQRLEGSSLFSPEYQQRQIPGEGGGGLLLAGQGLINRLNLDDCILISRLSAASRDKSVDSGGRVSGKLINQLTTGLLDVTGIDHAVIKTAILDTDHRANYLTEALEGLGQGFEHLDPIKDCLALGTSTGELSPVGGLVALACARAKVLASGAPALCISNQHPVERGVLLVTPFPAEADINPSRI